MQAAMSKAPLLLDYLSPESAANFAAVQKYLTAMGIAFVINPRMVRGLDYYTGTTFEFVHPDLGAQSGIGGGGRYDGLMETLGGQSLSGIGFGLGVDRALLAAIAESTVPSQEFTSDLFIIPLGDEAKEQSLVLAQSLRNSGIQTEIAFGDRALKGAMKAADKSGARYVIVLGESELNEGVIELKRMSDGVTTSVKIGQLQEELRRALSL
jgi:histidyl-tRNA synthetase